MSGANVEWRGIPGWPEYECSSRGDIRRIKAAMGATIGKVLKWQITPNGYAKVTLSRDGKRSQHLVHRLVAMAFIGDIPVGMDVCHFDGDKLNNSVGNLRIDTRKGNMADQIRMGKTPRGVKSGTNRHPPEVVLKIRSLKLAGARNVDIARALGLREQYVCNVLSGRIWGWL